MKEKAFNISEDIIKKYIKHISNTSTIKTICNDNVFFDKNMHEHMKEKIICGNKHSGKYDLIINYISSYKTNEELEELIEKLIKNSHNILIVLTVDKGNALFDNTNLLKENIIKIFYKKKYTLNRIALKEVWEDFTIDALYSENTIIFTDKSMQDEEIILNAIHPQRYFNKCFEYNDKIRIMLNELFVNKKYNEIVMLKNMKIPYIDYFYGRVCLLREKFDLGEEKLKKFLSISEHDYLIYDENIILSATYYLALIHYKVENYDKAINLFNKCLELSNNQHNMAKYYLNILGE